MIIVDISEMEVKITLVMGYLNNKLLGIAAVLEEAMMEKMALTREQKKELTRSRRQANIAGRKANKNVADVMHKADDLLGGNIVGAMTPHEIARHTERTIGKEGLKQLQAAAQIASQQEALAGGIAGGASGWKGIMDEQNKLLSGKLGGANLRINELTDLLNRADERLDTAHFVQDQLRDRLSDANRFIGKLGGQFDAAEAGRLKALDDLANFKNLGRFANAAKWIKGNPKKSIGAAVLGGTGLFGGGVGGGYLLKDYLDSRKEQ